MQNFRPIVQSLLRSDAAVQVAGVAELEAALSDLLSNPDRRLQLGDNAKRLVVEQSSGATARTVEFLLRALQPLP